MFAMPGCYMHSGIAAHVADEFFGEVGGGDTIGAAGDGGAESGDFVEAHVARIGGADGVGPEIGVDGDGGLSAGPGGEAKNFA